MNGVSLFVIIIGTCGCSVANMTLKHLAMSKFHEQSGLITHSLRTRMETHMSRFSKFLGSFVTGNVNMMRISFCAFEKFRAPVLAATAVELIKDEVFTATVEKNCPALHISDCTFCDIISKDAVSMDSADFVNLERCFFTRNELSGHGVKVMDECDSNMSQITGCENMWSGVIGSRARKLGSWRIEYLNISGETESTHRIEFRDARISNFVVSRMTCGLSLFICDHHTEMYLGKIYDISSEDMFFCDIESKSGGLVCNQVMFGHHTVPDSEAICHIAVHEDTCTLSNCCFWFPEAQWVWGDAIITDGEQHDDCCDFSPVVVPYGIIKDEDVELAFGRRILSLIQGR